MNKLVETAIHWSIHKIGFHTDIKKMNNSVKFVEDDWCLQQYIQQKDLVDPRKLPEEKVIKTIIYGVKSSGNQAERQTYKKLQVNQTVQNDIYVDDCLSGEENVEKALQSR